MAEKFLKIVVTPERPEASEVKTCIRLLEGGIDFIHLRHPDADDAEMQRLVEQFPEHLRSRVRLHSAFRLVGQMGLAGAHLNHRHPTAPPGISLTKSCHSIDEIEDISAYDYVTLSPVFDSISKPGYKSAFDLEALRNKLASKCVIALGGVTPEHFRYLADTGFSGAMMLGYIWDNSDTPLEVKLKEINLRCCNL